MRPSLRPPHLGDSGRLACKGGSQARSSARRAPARALIDGDTGMTQTQQPRGVALVIGAGDATGGAIARRFAREGYISCVTRRSADKLGPLVDSIRAEGGQAHGYASDARKEDEVQALFERIEAEHGPIEVLVFNIGANVPCSVLDETARKYFKIWEMACFSGFLNAQAAARRMVRRGRQACAAGPGPEHGARAGPARHPCGPCGGRRRHRHRVHPSNFPERYALKAQDGILNPEHIADNYWLLHQQPRDAWTFELDLRPYMERW